MPDCPVEIGHPGQIEVFHGIDSRVDRRHGAGQQKDEQISRLLHQQGFEYRCQLAMMTTGARNLGVRECSRIHLGDTSQSHHQRRVR